MAPRPLFLTPQKIGLLKYMYGAYTYIHMMVRPLAILILTRLEDARSVARAKKRPFLSSNTDGLDHVTGA